MRIVIASTFTADPIVTALSFWASVLSIPTNIVVSPYNQVFQQLLDPNSMLRSNSAGVNVIAVRLEDWVAYDYNASRNYRDANYFIQGVRASAAGGQGASSIIVFCPSSPKVVAEPESRQIVNDYEDLLTSTLSTENGVSIIGSETLLRGLGESVCFDDESEKLGGIPYTDEFMAFLGTAVMRKLAGSRRKPYKVIVLDCDQTLWKGVCGEDGVGGLQIEPGHAFLQQFMINQHLVGRLLCLCSKNNPLDVDEVFRTHPGMILQQHHILASRIGWLPKADGIRSLASQLGLDLDSFIFIDDDAVECAQMRANCPEVLTIQLPADSGQIPSVLLNIWAFDVTGITDEDRNRHAFYQKELQRSELKTSSVSLDQFLIDLGLETFIRPATSDLSARISQLTKRTNQFNLNGTRHPESELVSLMSKSLCLAIDAKDRFGDYGTIGAAICISDADEFRLAGLWISCRAMGRGIEHRVVKEIIDRASVSGFASMRISYAETGKNAPVRMFLEEIGARELPDMSERILEFARFSEYREKRLYQHLDTPPMQIQKHLSYRAPWQTVERIATEWSDPKTVVTAIREYKRRFQSASN